MKQPALVYCNHHGYSQFVTRDVLQTIIDRNGTRLALPHILRDSMPPLRNNIEPTLRKEVK